MSEKHLLDQPGWPMAHTRNDDAADEVNQHSQVADEPQHHPRPHSSQVRTLRKKPTTRQSPNGAQAIEHEDMPVSDKPSSSLTRLEVRERFSPTLANSVIANPHTPSGSSSPVVEDSQNSRPESATSTPLSSWSSHANSPAKPHDDLDDASDSGVHPIDLSYLRSGSSTPVPSTQPSKVPLSIDSGEGPSTVMAQTRHVEKEPKCQDDSNEANPIVVLDDDHFEISDDEEDDDKVEIIDITAPTRQSHYPPMDAMPRVPGSSFREGFRLPSLRRLVSSMEPDSSSQRSQPQRSSSIMSVRLVVQDDDDDITGGYEDRYGRDNVRIDSEVQEIQFDRYHPWAQGPVQFIVPTEQHALEETPEQRRLEQYEQELGQRQIEQAYDMDDNLPYVDYDDADESSNDEERHNGSQDQGLTDDEERVSEQQVEEHAQYILNLQASLGRSQLMSPPSRRGIRLAGTAPSRERLLSPDQRMLSPDRRFRERMLSPARRSGMLPDSRDRVAQPRGRQPSVEPIRLTSPSSRSRTPRSRAGSTVSTRPEFEEIFAVPDRSSLGPSRRPSVSREPSMLVQRTPRSHDVRYTPNRRPSRMLSRERPYLREGLTESAAIEVPDSPRPSPSPPNFPRSAVDEILGSRDSTMRSPSPTRAGSIVRRARRDVQRTVIDLDDSPGPSPGPSPSPTTPPPPTSLATGASPTPPLMHASFLTPTEPLSLSEIRSNVVVEIPPTDHGTRSSMVQRTGSRISQETRFNPNRRSRSRQPSQETTARGLASLTGLSERSEQDAKKDDSGLWAGARLVCSVCMDTVTDAMSTPCGHLYCRDCIETSLEYDRRCPQCRAPLTRGKLQSLAFYLNKTTTTITTTTATTTATTTPAVASAVAAKT
ncbi:hypothetical protein CPB97_010760 [Podila verticillata]|nr:hypothetical protein CPB97_010760 [Podila verticillata]